LSDYHRQPLPSAEEFEAAVAVLAEHSDWGGGASSTRSTCTNGRGWKRKESPASKPSPGTTSST
jgi:hypothetical protein